MMVWDLCVLFFTGRARKANACSFKLSNLHFLFKWLNQTKVITFVEMLYTRSIRFLMDLPQRCNLYLRWFSFVNIHFTFLYLWYNEGVGSLSGTELLILFDIFEWIIILHDFTRSNVWRIVFVFEDHLEIFVLHSLKNALNFPEKKTLNSNSKRIRQKNKRLKAQLTNNIWIMQQGLAII